MYLEPISCPQSLPLKSCYLNIQRTLTFHLSSIGWGRLLLCNPRAGEERECNVHVDKYMYMMYPLKCVTEQFRTIQHIKLIIEECIPLCVSTYSQDMNNNVRPMICCQLNNNDRNVYTIKFKVQMFKVNAFILLLCR
jgi:hypothetical protein